MNSSRTDALKPIYQQIREDLLVSFRETGEVQLPSERELCRRYGVCRPTVHKALSSLVENGLIVRRPGKGSCFCLPEEKPPRAATGVKLVIRRDWKEWSSDHYFGMTVQGICSSLNQLGVTLTIEQFSDKLLLELLPDDAPPSIWLSPEKVEQEMIRTLADAGHAVTVINRLMQHPNVTVISGDHGKDGETAARFAVKQKARQVFFILQEADSGLALPREEGMRKVLDGVVPFRSISLPFEGLEQAMKKLAPQLNAAKEEAIVLLNNRLLLQPALESFPYPEKILLFADNTEPLLTGVNLLVMPVVEIGRQAGLAAVPGRRESARQLFPGTLRLHA